MSRRPHTLSPTTRDALATLGLQIAAGRRERGWTVAECAERAGLSPNTLRNVERGVPTVAVGTVLELAVLTGVRLFGVPPQDLPAVRARTRDRLALLPSRVRRRTEPADDNF
ncbi:helix-turn-helix domain-containing protein [Myceligenerans indicum]|uniref:Helix-turn-helix transcriptional regulator n=1 Tax=Myceligenerans indicum TaxID=2593663 RepID=A0ABS1LH56_9MICO|nr:helix-turn-helix transcriptional regulator [Myceligenerans indicum]